MTASCLKQQLLFNSWFWHLVIWAQLGFCQFSGPRHICWTTLFLVGCGTARWPWRGSGSWWRQTGHEPCVSHSHMGQPRLLRVAAGYKEAYRNGKGPWMPRLEVCVLGSHRFFCVMLYKESQQTVSGSREEKRDSTPWCKVKVWRTGEGNPTLVFSLPLLSPSCHPVGHPVRHLVAILLVLVCVYCYHEILQTE